MKIITATAKEISRLKIPVKIMNPDTGESGKYMALWDTGANVSLVSCKVAKELNLPTLDEMAHITALNHAELMTVC